MLLTGATSGLIYTMYSNASQNNQALFNCCKNDEKEAMHTSLLENKNQNQSNLKDANV